MPIERIGESKMTSKNQITLPKEVKDVIGAEQGDYVIFYREDGRIFIQAGQIVDKKKAKA